ncbi:endonuclease/exonuclease/phosphatase family protein [Lederbergia panacisoli]|uniref:endonuclease/exonuclease/phosphatase family protein n=1 Tax=Lederbergia panacisoli TaxID=1255251 RepID=UPI00214D0917|nr:endonuclease/exonuclease/phosphatase family protein [Lederbergia panacisoli]MCR2823431.1 endonuclease/exonuclease/phosphatase family protein [Lederbergia panacisoli]
MNIRIMTYNVRNDCDAPPNSWNERKVLIRDLIKRESPDIIGTQECKFNQVQDLDELLEEYNWIGLGREGGSKGEFMAIFYKKSRFQVTEYDHFWLSDTPDVIGSSTWGNDCTRMATWVHFLDKRTNQSFYHLNTHLDHVSENARVKGSELIVKQSEAFDSSAPIFITGDFNTVAESDSHKVFLKGDFIDTWDSAIERIHEELGSFNNFNDPTGGEGRIDWILYRGDVKVGTLKIVNDQINGRFPSDHFPIVVDIEI